MAPFKAQNMSNNSMVVAGPEASAGSSIYAGSTWSDGTATDGTATGGAEMGRAQWAQAIAAGATPEVAMNPVLLKPGGERDSHVVLMGQPAGQISSAAFAEGRRHLAETAHAAFDDLADRFDIVVCEGAGSPAEFNLRDSDYVNMGLAQHGQLPTVVVGDIDRGGVFAALLGTLSLLDAADQSLIAGFIINKFRGDVSLLAPALDRMQALTGRPIFGVLPWHDDVWLDAEDALAVPRPVPSVSSRLRVRVIKLPRMSNFTDADALGLEPGIDLQFAAHPRECADADLLIVPGTRSTLSDLAWLRQRGLAEVIDAHARAGKPVLGICGGFQMLGGPIHDPDGIEGAVGAEEMGLGLLDIATRFSAEKVLRLPQGAAFGEPAHGYEIHHGHIRRGDDADFLGGAWRGSVFGTMWHGSLEADGFRHAFLAHIAALGGTEFISSGTEFAAARHARLEILADLAEQYLDVGALIELARNGVPAYSPLPPGGTS